MKYKVGEEIVIVKNTRFGHNLTIGSIGKIIKLYGETLEIEGESKRRKIYRQQTLHIDDIAPNFKVGNLVKIREDSQFYNISNNINNPYNQIGKINNIGEYDYTIKDAFVIELPINVKWTTANNTYNHIDLELVSNEIIEEKPLIIVKPIEELGELNQKNNVLIATIQLLSSKKFVKIETIQEQLKLNEPNYNWETNVIYDWLIKLGKFRTTKQGNWALKIKN